MLMHVLKDLRPFAHLNNVLILLHKRCLTRIKFNRPDPYLNVYPGPIYAMVIRLIPLSQLHLFSQSRHYQ